MKTRFIITLGLILLLGLLAPLASAQDMENGPDSDLTMDQTQAWVLTPEQQAQLQSMRSDLQQNLEPLHRKLMARKLELKAALLADTPEHERIDALVAEINRINGEIFSQQVALQVELAQQGMYGPIMSGPMGMAGPGMKHGKTPGMGMKHGGMMGGMQGKGMGMMRGGMMRGGMMGGMQGKGMGMAHGSGAMQHGTPTPPPAGQPGMADVPLPDEDTGHQGHQMQ